ncbi:hypothetical protein AC791_06150 [Klebsiella sp. RIT-PI-d]|uniref:hypothetical protein n=1 Tax=Klebsiella sp. RIT-PI-d TaxID=1681196 RepID=UPI000675F054|nr:hypothetical protein [Klebsiella sp. RIT-PI-d]KNC10656.1 hypothetical protein AC791_06150 [Klebsiella sp. RIT-PI-d]
MKQGAWEINSTVNKNITAIEDKHLEIFAFATEGLLGTKYDVLVHAGEQIVCGANHLYIAQQSIFTRDGESISLVKVVIYAPLEGKPVITHIEKI